jgi:hypothetical protein
MAAPYLAALHRTVAALQSQLSETQYQLQEARRFGRLTRELHCHASTLSSAPVDWIYNGDMRMWGEPVVDEPTDERGGGEEAFQAVQTWVEGLPALAANWSAHFEGYSYSLHGAHTTLSTASARSPQYCFLCPPTPPPSQPGASVRTQIESSTRGSRQHSSRWGTAPSAWTSPTMGLSAVLTR